MFLHSTTFRSFTGVSHMAEDLMLYYLFLFQLNKGSPSAADCVISSSWTSPVFCKCFCHSRNIFKVRLELLSTYSSILIYLHLVCSPIVNRVPLFPCICCLVFHVSGDFMANCGKGIWKNLMTELFIDLNRRILWNAKNWKTFKRRGWITYYFKWNGPY